MIRKQVATSFQLRDRLPLALVIRLRLLVRPFFVIRVHHTNLKLHGTTMSRAYRLKSAQSTTAMPNLHTSGGISRLLPWGSWTGRFRGNEGIN